MKNKDRIIKKIRGDIFGLMSLIQLDKYLLEYATDPQEKEVSAQKIKQMERKLSFLKEKYQNEICEHPLLYELRVYRDKETGTIYSTYFCIACHKKGKDKKENIESKLIDNCKHILPNILREYSKFDTLNNTVDGYINIPEDRIIQKLKETYMPKKMKKVRK